MGTVLQPTRFVLDAQQLTAALALAGLRPSERSSLPFLHPPAQPLPLLRSTSLLSQGGRTLSDEGLETLRVAADPGRLLSCTVNEAGAREWREVHILHAEAAEGPYVALEAREDRYEFALLPDAAGVTRFMEDLLGLKGFSPHPDTPSVTLDLAAYAALLAAADALQATRLRTRLGRTEPAKPVLTSDLLENQLKEGFSHPDTRWAVTSGQKVCPEDLKTTAGQMVAGLETLKIAGLVAPVQRGYGFTLGGFPLAAALSELVRTAGLTLSLPRGREQTTIGHASLFCCSGGLLIAEWKEGSPAAAMELRQVGASGATEVIQGFLKPVRAVPPARAVPKKEVPEERRCPSCRGLVAAGARFCSGCGLDLATAQALRCPRCGAGLKPGSRFCTSCGAGLPGETTEAAPTEIPAPPVETDRPPPAPRERRCSNPQCGQLVPAGKNFCTACGTRVPQRE